MLLEQTNFIKGKDYIGVGVGAVIFERNQILLLKRLKEPEVGYWSIPGGAIEFGETIEEAVKRELQEELAAEVDIVTLLGVTNHILPEEKLHWVSPVFLVKIIAGIPKNVEADKHSDLCWFKLENLPNNVTLTTKTAINFLNKYLAKQ